MLEVLRCINFKTPANTLWRHPFVLFGRRSTPHILEARADDRGHVHNADYFFLWFLNVLSNQNLKNCLRGQGIAVNVTPCRCLFDAAVCKL